MDDEQFEKWEPIGGLDAHMSLESMRDDHEGFRIILKADKPDARPLRIRFQEPVCYRGAAESHLLKQLYESHDIYPWPIFIVKNSRYAAWFYGQVGGDASGRHYHIAATDGMIDVISARPPIVTWLPE
ncbi:MAG: hypothetical protein NW215_07895 [Hyphomicrobiales bacterium]|nr:hypothetical protein [Hyphomicrobiales bacterium]